MAGAEEAGNPCGGREDVLLQVQRPRLRGALICSPLGVFTAIFKGRTSPSLPVTALLVERL